MITISPINVTGQSITFSSRGSRGENYNFCSICSCHDSLYIACHFNHRWTQLYKIDNIPPPYLPFLLCLVLSSTKIAFMCSCMGQLSKGKILVNGVSYNQKSFQFSLWELRKKKIFKHHTLLRKLDRISKWAWRHIKFQMKTENVCCCFALVRISDFTVFDGHVLWLLLWSLICNSKRERTALRNKISQCLLKRHELHFNSRQTRNTVDYLF